MPMADGNRIETLSALTALYGPVNPISLAKETPHLTPEYQKWIEAAPFFALASIGAGGLDCSPRGDAKGQAFQVVDNKTLVIPNRRGNNRLDTLKNIIADPRVALLFLIPGIHETLRVNGRAHISTNPGYLEHFRVQDKLPVSAIVVEIETVYFQCARALKRAQLWDSTSQLGKQDVPTAGQMSKGAKPDFDGDAYDGGLQARQAATLY